MMASVVRKTSWEGFSVEAFLKFPNRMQDAEDVLFKCVIEACGAANAEAHSEQLADYPELGKLIGSMGLWEMGFGDVLVLTQTETPPLVAVISGIIEVLLLDRRLLARAGSVTLSELLQIGETTDSPERNVAVSRTASMAFEDDHSLESVINFVEARGGVKVLDALLVEFRQEKDRLARYLVRLLGAEFPEVRARVVRSLALGWVPLAEGLKLANEAIGDADPAVRSAAVKTLRELNR